uniref:Large ribosomal subunit protein uL23c n=1 Tax=Sciadococcus taiwanensis TaxID=3028030 RepID=A0A9Y1I2E6_9RHOD|nr:ribosomal protein L23 [Sciadococcus taiwanensis]
MFKRSIMTKKSEGQLLDLIKHPIITDKTTRLFENNQYTFAINNKANKENIKSSIEHIFEVKVKAINTSNIPKKKRRVAKFVGYRSSFKKAIVTLEKGYTINLFPEN